MKIALIITLLFIAGTLTCHSQVTEDEYNVRLSDISLSDPFIYADESDSTYYMYGSGGNGTVMARASKDLVNWTDRFPVFRFPADHWAGERAPSWAAEVHRYKG